MSDTDDPLAALATAHLQRMQQISDAGYEKQKEICDHHTTQLRRFAGIRTTAIEKLLEASGILAPTEEPNQNPQ